MDPLQQVMSVLPQDPEARAYTLRLLAYAIQDHSTTLAKVSMDKSITETIPWIKKRTMAELIEEIFSEYCSTSAK